MSLLGDFAAYVDSLKRTAGNSLRDLRDDPQGLLSMRAAQLAESLPALPQSVMPGVDSAGLGPMRPTAQDWSMGAAMNAPTMGLLGHTVYHGSPHKFDKFDASKIGTGEGAQAYGHGLYLADAEDVASGYAGMRPAAGQSTLDGKPWSAERYAEMIGEARARGAGSYEKGIASLENDFQKAVDGRELNVAENFQAAIDALRNMQARGVELNTGQNLYKVDLPDEWLPKMLDWDKPLSQQPKAVRKAVEPIVAPIRKEMAKPTAAGWGDFAAPQKYDPTGAEVLALLRQQKDSGAQGILGNGLGPEVSQRLRDAGIPGIRYLDGGSRGAGQGTSNYVVFPGMEHLLKILSRE